MSYSVPPKPTPVPFPDNETLRAYRSVPDYPLKRMLSLAALPFVLLYCLWLRWRERR